MLQCSIVSIHRTIIECFSELIFNIIYPSLPLHCFFYLDSYFVLDHQENLKEIFVNITKADVPRSKKLGYYNAYVRLCHRVGPFQELVFTKEEMLVWFVFLVFSDLIGQLVSVYLIGRLVLFDLIGRLVSVDLIGRLVSVDLIGRLVSVDLIGQLVSVDLRIKIAFLKSLFECIGEQKCQHSQV